MNRTQLILIFLVTIIGLSSGCRRDAAQEIDFGTVTNGLYQNKYFGLTVALPPDWSIQDLESRLEMMEIGGDIVIGDDQNLRAAVDASKLTTVSLFTAFKHALGSPVLYNPNIVCVAERVRHMPGIREGRDYLFHTRKFLESSQVQVSFPHEITTASMGGQSFDVMQTEMPLGGMTIHQKYYSTIMDGYALNFIISFTTKEEELALRNILDSIEFQ